MIAPWQILLTCFSLLPLVGCGMQHRLCVCLCGRSLAADQQPKKNLIWNKSSEWKFQFDLQPKMKSVAWEAPTLLLMLHACVAFVSILPYNTHSHTHTLNYITLQVGCEGSWHLVAPPPHQVCGTNDMRKTPCNWQQLRVSRFTDKLNWLRRIHPFKSQRPQRRPGHAHSLSHNSPWFS